MEWLIVILVGLLAGTHTATWGMYKDAPHEGFTIPKYSRSIVVSTLVAPVVYAVLGLDALSAGDLVVLFGVIYVVERALTEFWKVFIRDEDQSKYFIPMQFHVLGKVIRNRWARLGIGIPYAAAVVALLFFIDWAQNAWDAPLWLQAVTLGSIGGWVSAVGGAWKDAPIEGFETFKFFRSPGVAAFYALLLTLLTTNMVVVALAAEGFTVMTLETHKTFFFPSKPRGKFAGKPVHFPRMLRLRQYFIPVYAAIWVVVVSGFALAFLDVVPA